MKNVEEKRVMTPVKLPEALKDWLKHMAIDNRRTLSNEIAFRLQESRDQQTSGVVK